MFVVGETEHPPGEAFAKDTDYPTLSAVTVSLNRSKRASGTPPSGGGEHPVEVPLYRRPSRRRTATGHLPGKGRRIQLPCLVEPFGARPDTAL